MKVLILILKSGQKSHKIFLYFEMGCIDFYIFQLHFHYRYFCSWIVHKEKLTLVDDTNPNSKQVHS